MSDSQRASRWLMAAILLHVASAFAATVQRLVGKYNHGRSWGFFGEPGVNVLELNLALDRLGGQQ